MAILIIAEHDNQHLNPTTLHIISAAQQLGEDLQLLIAGFHSASVVSEAQKIAGLNLILIADNQAYQHGLAENLAPLIQSIAADYQYILAPATTFGKNVLPRVAALLDTEQISDVAQILSADTFIRPIYAGNALATVQTKAKIVLLTVRPTNFAAAAVGKQECATKQLTQVFDTGMSSFVELNSTDNHELPDLNTARVVIAGGRGLQSKENFALLEQLAHKLNAALGASRAAVDAGFVPNDLQIGQTGKVVAPQLYIAVGISGAIQHIAGMKDSKVIVAINKDPEAPIFQIADYGLVGDLFTLIPELTAAISESL